MREAGTTSATNVELTSMFQPLLYQCVDLNHRASRTIREMQIETTMRDLCMPDRMAILKTRQKTTSVGKAVKNCNLCTLLLGMQNGAAIMENSTKVPQKIKTKTVYDPGGTSGKEPACQCRRLEDTGSIPGSGRSPGGGHGNPLRYSCLENPMDRGAWRATVRKVTKSRAQTEVT